LDIVPHAFMIVAYLMRFNEFLVGHPDGHSFPVVEGDQGFLAVEAGGVYDMTIDGRALYLVGGQIPLSCIALSMVNPVRTSWSWQMAGSFTSARVLITMIFWTRTRSFWRWHGFQPIG